jgi:hypothetical protein
MMAMANFLVAAVHYFLVEVPNTKFILGLNFRTIYPLKDPSYKDFQNVCPNLYH